MWLNPTTGWQTPSTLLTPHYLGKNVVIPSLRHLNWGLKHTMNFRSGLLQEGIIRVTAGGLAGNEGVRVDVVFPGLLHALFHLCVRYVVGGDRHIQQG